MILSEALALTNPFASTDKTRPHMSSPFGFVAGGHDWIGATDGHRAAIVRCPGHSDYKTCPDHPPLAAVIPTDAPYIGDFELSAIKPLREIPRTWRACLWRDGQSVHLTASRDRGSASKRERIRLFDGAVIQCALPGLPAGIKISIEYLIAAAEFCGTATIHVRHGGESEPIAFAPTSDALLDNHRFALVMPIRG